jgi:hypothetical protein
VEEPLVAHLEREGLQFIQFAFRWVNCLLLREVPFALAVRLWDTYLCEGCGARAGNTRGLSMQCLVLVSTSKCTAPVEQVGCVLGAAAPLAVELGVTRRAWYWMLTAMIIFLLSHAARS